jgi:hypothetical protein
MTFYKFQGYRFEVHYYFGPTPIRLRGADPRKTIPKGFWKMWDEFTKLTKKQRVEFQIDPWATP